MPTSEEIEAAVRAHAPQFEHMDKEIQGYAFEQMRRALTAAEQVRGTSEPVAHAYVVNGECEQIEWGTEATLSDDPSLVWLYAAPVQPGDGWQPIETAPKDGTPFLLANKHGTWVGHYVDQFTSGYRPKNPWQTLMLNHRHIPYDKSDDGVPTHWMPLPATPTPEKGGE